MLRYNREGQDPGAIAELLRWLEDHNKVSRGLLLPDGEIGDLEAVRRVLGYVPSWIETFSSRAVKMRPLLADWFRQKYGHREGEYNILDDTDFAGQLKGRDALHQSLYLWSKTMMAGYILVMLGDRMEMAHSIEGRVPFLDHKLVELIAGQPVNQKIRGMTEKYVLREAVKDVITETVYKRQKHPFLSPPATLSPDDSFQTFVQDMLRGETMRAMPFFSQKEAVALLDRLPGMEVGERTAFDQVLMHLVSLCVLQEGFGLSSVGVGESREATLSAD